MSILSKKKFFTLKNKKKTNKKTDTLWWWHLLLIPADPSTLQAETGISRPTWATKRPPDLPSCYTCLEKSENEERERGKFGGGGRTKE